MSSFRGLGTTQSSQGFRGMSRSFTARSKAAWSIRWTLWTVVVLRQMCIRDRMWVNRLTHTVTHTLKEPESFKECRTGSLCFLSGFFRYFT